GDAEQSVQTLGKAAVFQKDESKALSLYYRGAILNRLARYDEARASLDEALAERDDLILARQEKGESLWQLGRREEAVTVWTNALQRNAQLVLTNNELAGAARASGKLDEAGLYEKQADLFTPNNPLYHWVLGRRLQDLGMIELADKHFQQANQLGGNRAVPNKDYRSRNDCSGGDSLPKRLSRCSRDHRSRLLPITDHLSLITGITALSERRGAKWLPRRITPANSGLLRTRPRCRTGPRCGRGPYCWQDINHSSHSSKAVYGAEILVHAGLRKSELIHEPCVVKDSGVTVHVIRRTKLPIGGAGRATGDTMKIALPGPAHGVADADVDGIRHKTEFVS